MSDICNNCTDRGMCCRYMDLPLARPLSADERHWIDLHTGVQMLDATTIHINIACSALTEEGNCSLYDTPERPAMCSVWPTHRVQMPEGCAFIALTEVY